MHEKHQLQDILHVLEHYLPSQAPLKDFIHHNTLHAFQDQPFHKGLHAAQQLFGFQTYLSLEAYRDLYTKGAISADSLDRALADQNELTKDQLFHFETATENPTVVGSYRLQWKKKLGFDLDARVHPLLFRIVNSFLDQGIAIWRFPTNGLPFLAALRQMESENTASIFSGERARNCFLNPAFTLQDALDLLVGDQRAFENYLYDQQFAHPGYAGMIAQIANRPNLLVLKREISFEDFVLLECLLEIDALDQHHGSWIPAAKLGLETYQFDPKQVLSTTAQKLKAIWQDAYEWTYYDQVLASLQQKVSHDQPKVSSIGIFCIDDRECSIRRHIEQLNPSFLSFGTPGHFNIETYFQAHGSLQRTKICPAPVQPTHLIVERSVAQKKQKEWHFDARAYGLLIGWVLTHTYGFWSALKLALSILWPSKNTMAVSSQQHMDPDATLSIEHVEGQRTPDGLQIGFTVEEMTAIVGGMFKSIGLQNQFSPLVYLIAHGSSSANNTHYAGYDCGACSGRPGSVNARVFAHMANHPMVRQALRNKQIDIPDQTHFVPILQDTARDEFIYYDLNQFPPHLVDVFEADRAIFANACQMNAVERSRRFITVNSHAQPKKVYRKVQLRTVSLFEPRPELNHATNALCIVGRRQFSRDIFLDRRAFLNSYDYRIDPAGDSLSGILNAVAPVCGGINLEYYFSRVDNEQLGAGSKLPHNVMGLLGVANGVDGDLRTGLPSQMIEIHDPYRLMVIVEQKAQVVLAAISRNPNTFEWFANEWVRLVSYDPDTNSFAVFNNGQFQAYQPQGTTEKLSDNLLEKLIQTHENYPVVELSNIAS
ncbi:MAG: hypothetical protein RI948_519 [Bacteroidota bacterium]|jgi:uncharacterized protein YbcC (UPF0753/DUF2309 family)